MFAVIGKKIIDKLNASADLRLANNVSSFQYVTNTTFNDTQAWNVLNGSQRVANNVYVWERDEAPSPADGDPTASGSILNLTVGKEYICNVSYYSQYKDIEIGIGTVGDVYGFTVYKSGTLPSTPYQTYEVYTFTFTATSTTHYFTIKMLASGDYGPDTLANINDISVFEVGTKKVFPVIIPQKVNYPAVTYEISNVTNFMSKGSSLNSCNVSIRIACFADSYGTTYNQAKAIVEALDLYSVTYTEDGQSYTAKFRFIDLDDEYYKNAEKFYKNINFDCLIIKN